MSNRSVTAAFQQQYQYDERHPGEIDAFLAAHPYLDGLLEEAPAQYAKYFPESPLKLMLITDPEESEAAVHLLIVALTNLPLEEASSKLEQMDREWWFNVLDQANSRLAIDMEFV